VQRVFVGDVQGCAKELASLLKRARAEFGRDFELWQVGDLVNRGPDNVRVLELVRGLHEQGRASLILGNHEISLLRTAAGQRPPGALDSFGDLLEGPDRDDWLEWLRRLPLARTGEIAGRPFAMVHAAVHPDWDLGAIETFARAGEKRLGHRDRAECEKFLAELFQPDASKRGRVHDAVALMLSCRSVRKGGAWSSEPPETAGAGARPWHVSWSKRGHSYGIVYGHWSLQGLHVASGLRGLDTGCVHHGRGRDGYLTAWLPEPGRKKPFSVPDDRFWQIPARRSYID
jgi:bis(5'-nucleosyl)-tetraphosphatase (symmetrical)